MLSAIEHAQSSVGLEIYILQDGEIGTRFRDALTAAARRGLRVRVLVDAFGSFELSADFLEPIEAAGGHCRWFNPLELRRFHYRDHRKLLIVDDQTAIIGGFNIGREYDGDGRTEGWRDLGMRLQGEVVGELARAFHGMFGAASFRHRRLFRFRRNLRPQEIRTPQGNLYLLSPGLGPNPLKHALAGDIRRSRRIHLTTAYFMPPGRIRRAMISAARKGAEVQLLVAGISDVRLAQWAAWGQYGRLLRAGVQIYEYQPAVLHSKCYLMDDIAYVGSANLDLRSLSINYELLLRIQDAEVAAAGHKLFLADLEQSRQITRDEYRDRPWFRRVLELIAGTVLERLDLGLAMRRLSLFRGGRLPPRIERQRDLR